MEMTSLTREICLAQNGDFSDSYFYSKAVKMCSNWLYFSCFNCLTEQIDLLDHLWQVANHSNASLTEQGRGFPVLHVGLYSTLSIPLRQVFENRYTHSPSTDSIPLRKCIFYRWTILAMLEKLCHTSPKWSNNTSCVNQRRHVPSA